MPHSIYFILYLVLGTQFLLQVQALPQLHRRSDDVATLLVRSPPSDGSAQVLTGEQTEELLKDRRKQMPAFKKMPQAGSQSPQNTGLSSGRTSPATSSSQPAGPSHPIAGPSHQPTLSGPQGPPQTSSKYFNGPYVPPLGSTWFLNPTSVVGTRSHSGPLSQPPPPPDPNHGLPSTTTSQT